MVVLEVGIDARGAVTGGQQASSALNGLASAAAFAFNELGRTNTAMAALGSRITLFAAGASAVGAALGAIVTGITLMADNTTKATQEWQRLGEAVDNASRKMQAALSLGLPASPHARAIMGSQFDALAKVTGPGAQPIAFSDLMAPLEGVMSQTQVLQMIAAQGGPRELIEFGAEGRYRLPASGVAAHKGGRVAYSDDPSGIGVPPEIARQILQTSYRMAGTREFALRSSEASAGVSGVSEMVMRPGGASRINMREIVGDPIAGTGGLPSDMFTEGVGTVMFTDQQMTDRMSKEAVENMREIELLSQRVGATLGDGVFDFVAGLRDGRDIMASILIDVGRGFSREAIATFTKSIISQFGRTGGQ